MPSFVAVNHGILGEYNAAFAKPSIRGFMIPSAEDFEASKVVWRAMYDHYGNRSFILLVDLTDLSMSALSLLPQVARFLSEMRPRSEQQVIVTGILLNPVASMIMDALFMLYVPTTHFVKAQSELVLRTHVLKWIAENKKPQRALS